MPPGITPEQFLTNILINTPNGAADSAEFNMVNQFIRRSTSATPALGDIYDIDFGGPDNEAL